MITHPDITTQRQVTSACPDQWEGQLSDGRWFYFRYRFGKASLALGDTPEEVGGRQHVLVLHGDALQGAFDSDCERDDVFMELMQLLA